MIIIALMLIFIQTVGCYCFLYSSRCFLALSSKKMKVTENAFFDILLGISLLGLGLFCIYIFGYMVIFETLTGEGVKFIWTIPISILLSLYLFFVYQKKGSHRKSKNKNKSKNEFSVSKWIGAITSDLSVLLVYIGIFIGFIFLLVKLVKHFWYM